MRDFIAEIKRINTDGVTYALKSRFSFIER